MLCPCAQGPWPGVEMTAHLDCFVGSRIPTAPPAILSCQPAEEPPAPGLARWCWNCRKLFLTNQTPCRSFTTLVTESVPPLRPARCRRPGNAGAIRDVVSLRPLFTWQTAEEKESWTGYSSAGVVNCPSTKILRYPGATWNLWSQNEMIDRATRLPEAPQGEGSGHG